MNIKKILFLFSLPLLIAACSDSDSNETTNPADNGEVKSVFLKINASVTGNTPRNENSLRSDEATQTGQSAELLTAIVYFLDGSADPVIFATRIVGEGTDANITMAQLTEGYEFQDIPSSVTQVYVVGNYNSSDANDNEPTYPTTPGQTLSQVKATVLNIEQVAHGATGDGQTNTGLLTVMDGQATVQEYDTDPGDWNGDEDPLPAESLYANVTISPINSRIEIVQLTYTGTEIQSLTLEGIYINYYYQTAPLSLNFTGYAPVNNGSNVNNYDRTNPGFAYVNYPSMYDFIDEQETPAGTPEATAEFIPNNGTWAYHVFGNSQPVPHIVLKFTDVFSTSGSNLGNRYITVTGFMNGNNEVGTLARNTIYKINNLTFTDDDLQILPETETVNIWVHVEVANWVTVIVTPVI